MSADADARMVTGLVKVLCIYLFLLIFSGCTQIGYYAQSVSGQLDIWSRERPIQNVIDDPATPQALRENWPRRKNSHTCRTTNIEITIWEWLTLSTI